MSLKPLTASPRFASFIAERDKALERILSLYAAELSKIVAVLKKRTLEMASHLAVTGQTKAGLRRSRNTFESNISPWFDMASERASALVPHMRKSVYILSAAGQAEAIGRAIGKKTKLTIDYSAIDRTHHRDAPSGGTVPLRVEYIFHQLLRKVIAAFQLSQIHESPVNELLSRIERAFPPEKKSKTLRTKMAPMREREVKGPGDRQGFSFIQMEESDWQDALQDYLSDQIPFGRAPYDKVFELPGDDNEDARYQWELENEVTEDFVQSVRDGENDAAKQNGIDDFQWIAVTDKVTDDCCLARDGLTTTEIEEKLDAGEDMGDSDATSAPAHFSCRCRMAPMTEDMPDEEPADFGGFDDWLMEKGRAA